MEWIYSSIPDLSTVTKSELTKQELTRWEVEKIFHLICFYLKTLGWMHGDAVLIPQLVYEVKRQSLPEVCTHT